MENIIKITKKELIEVAGYESKPFPKYTAPLLNMFNRWARGTASNVVGQMSDLVPKCPYKDYKKWREWYLEKHPKAIENSTDLIMKKIDEVKKQFDKIDKNIIKMWVEDLVIDKSFWGLKVQEAILKKLGEMTNKKWRLATQEEENKGVDGFVGDLPVQIKPGSKDSAPPTVMTEKLRAKTVYYEKQKNGDYLVDVTQLKNILL